MPASTSTGAAVVLRGDQSPVPAKNRVRGHDAGDLRQDTPAELFASHGESTALGVGQSNRSPAKLLPEIIDQIFLVAVHPASQDGHEEVQSRGHSLSLVGRHGQRRPCLGGSLDPGRFFAPYARAMRGCPSCEGPHSLRLRVSGRPPGCQLFLRDRPRRQRRRNGGPFLLRCLRLRRWCRRRTGCWDKFLER